MKLSDTQRLALALAAEGPLQRWRGGYWAPPGETDRYGGQNRHGTRVPVRCVGLQTVDALEARGLLERCHATENGIAVEEWRDPRRITDAGRAAL